MYKKKSKLWILLHSKIYKIMIDVFFEVYISYANILLYLRYSGDSFLLVPRRAHGRHRLPGN